MLHALVEYARKEGIVTEPGFKPKVVRWLLLFSSDGEYLGLQDLRGENAKGKGQEFSACPDLTQPEMIAIGDGCRHFLVDSLEVIALLTKEEEVTEKLTAKHEFFVRLLENASQCMPELKAVGSTLSDCTHLERIRKELLDKKAKPTDAATLAVSSDSMLPVILVEENFWHEWWRTCRTELLGGKKSRKPPGKLKKKADAEAVPSFMRCFLSGEPTTPMPTHNKIEGLSDVGGLSMGDALTSFDKEAFTSFGFVQGANASMSETMAKTYVSALNDLIRKRSHRLSGVKIIYWYDKPAEELVKRFGDPFPNLWGDDNQEVAVEDNDADSTSLEVEETHRADKIQRNTSENAVKKLLDAFHTGDMEELTREKLQKSHYFAMTISANSGRVVVRDWMEGSFQDLVESIDAWFKDLAIIDRYGQRIIDHFKFYSLVAASVRDIKDSVVALQNALFRSAIKRQAIPRALMAQTLRRTQLDVMQGESPRHARYALLKAFLIRNERINMNSELNELEGNPAYLCGRIIAVLAGIQEAAIPNVKAGVVERFYAAASTTPALVLGRLVRTAQIAHLPKIGNDRKGLEIWFENNLTEIWNKMNQQPPTSLTLEQQTLFAMGFYHQKAKRNGKTTEDGDNSTKE